MLSPQPAVLAMPRGTPLGRPLTRGPAKTPGPTCHPLGLEELAVTEVFPRAFGPVSRGPTCLCLRLGSLEYKKYFRLICFISNLFQIISNSNIFLFLNIFSNINPNNTYNICFQIRKM